MDATNQLHSASMLIALSLLLSSGCSLRQPLHEQRIGDLGRFEFRESDHRMEGVVIGAPRGGSEPDSRDYAKWISDRTGAGLVVAYGFRAKRLLVAQPLVLSTPNLMVSEDPIRRGSIYTEFKKLLQTTANGNVEFYVGIRSAASASDIDQIEVATSGFTLEEIRFLKESFLRIRDRALADSSAPKISIVMEPLDKISWRVAAIKHHGVLMSTERGLNLRLPKIMSDGAVKTTYREIFSSWITEAFKLVSENHLGLPQIDVRLLEHGRIESIPSRKHRNGVVIGAPHGSFDEHTAEMVTQISNRTGLAAVIAKGFTPTECAGWRINVNRPTERRYPSGDIEIDSKRAREVYQIFKELVLEASQGSLDLYIDIHQNGRQNNIEVATVGVTKEQAKIIKSAYRTIRDQAFQNVPNVEIVDLLIEPLDEVEIGAWAAKADGILSVAKKSLHFELPAHPALSTSKTRDTYARIMAMLLNRVAYVLHPPIQESIYLQGLAVSGSVIDQAGSEK